MSLFRVQERDLDLVILEELHSDTGFSDWLAEQVGLKGCAFVDAKHSVSAKADAKWGETDVMAFFSNENERIALLIEDKISANFTERQAQRYHDRAQEIVREDRADRYLTLLVAPQVYLASVPEDDPWNERLSIESIRDWFAKRNDAHARWRERTLNDCIFRSLPAPAPGLEDVQRFSVELSTYLAHHHSPALSHRPGRDASGPIIHYAGFTDKKML